MVKRMKITSVQQCDLVNVSTPSALIMGHDMNELSQTLLHQQGEIVVVSDALDVVSWLGTERRCSMAPS